MFTHIPNGDAIFKATLDVGVPALETVRLLCGDKTNFLSLEIMGQRVALTVTGLEYRDDLELCYFRGIVAGYTPGNEYDRRLSGYHYLAVCGKEHTYGAIVFSAKQLPYPPS